MNPDVIDDADLVDPDPVLPEIFGVDVVATVNATRADVQALLARVAAMEDTLAKMLAVIEAVQTEVAPLLTRLQSHPMLRMFLGG